MKVHSEKIVIFKDLLFLTLIIGVLYSFMLGSFPLEVPDGARYAEIPREMVATHDYLTPHLNGIKYFEKPPLFYWLQSGVIKTFGLGEWSIHSTNAVLALILCLMVYGVTRKLYNRRAAILSSLVLATSALFFILGRIITLDMALTTFLSGALFSFILGTRAPPGTERRLYMWSMYAFAALAVMTKGLVGIFLPGFIIVVWVAFFHQWHHLKTYCLISGTLLFLLIAAPWHILVTLKNPEFLRFYFVEQHFLRYLTPYASREQPFWYFTAIFCGGFLPWIFFLPHALKLSLPLNKLKTEFKNYKTEIFLVLWSLLIFIFYNFSDSKLPPYILPMFPPLAIIIGNFFAHSLAHGKRLIKHEVNIFCLSTSLLGLAVLITPYWFDFTQAALTPFNFYLIAIGLLLSSLVTYYAYVKYDIKSLLVALFITTMFFLLSIAPAINIANDKSVRPLISLISPQLTTDTEVVMLQDYFQDVPYYLRRKVIVAGYPGELDFGMLYTPCATQWMISMADFWKLWNGPKRIFVFVAKDKYAKIAQKFSGKNKHPLIGQYLSTVVLTNRLK